MTNTVLDVKEHFRVTPNACGIGVAYLQRHEQNVEAGAEKARRQCSNAAASDPQMLDMAKSAQEEHIAPLSCLPQMATTQASMVCVAILLVQAIVLPALDWAAAPDVESCVDGVSEWMERVRIAQGVHRSALLPAAGCFRLISTATVETAARLKPLWHL